MSLDVTAPGSVERATHVVEVVATSVIRVTGIVFDFDDEWMALEVSFGVDSGGFSPKRTEMWIASGAPLNNILTMAPAGGTRLAVFRNFVSDIVNRLQTTQGLKQQLLDSGDLRIVNGSISGVFT